MKTLTTFRASAFVALALSSVIACSAGDTLKANAGNSVSLSFTSDSPTASGSLASGASAALIPVTSNGHTLDLTKVELNLSRVELHTSEHGEMEDECEHHSDCGVIAGSPLMVTLTPTNAMVTVTTAVVPPGTYREIGIKVQSVHLVGTFDSKPFDVTVNVNVEREIEFNPPVTIGDSTDTQRNVTIAVPLTSWLTNPDGTLIDPSTLATTPTLRAAVEQRIRASLRAFRDDNHNSRDDDNDEHQNTGDHH